MLSLFLSAVSISQWIDFSTLVCLDSGSNSIQRSTGDTYQIERNIRLNDFRQVESAQPDTYRLVAYHAV